MVILARIGLNTNHLIATIWFLEVKTSPEGDQNELAHRMTEGSCQRLSEGPMSLGHLA